MKHLDARFEDHEKKNEVDQAQEIREGLKYYRDEAENLSDEFFTELEANNPVLYRELFDLSKGDDTIPESVTKLDDVLQKLGEEYAAANAEEAPEVAPEGDFSALQEAINWYHPDTHYPKEFLKQFRDENTKTFWVNDKIIRSHPKLFGWPAADWFETGRKQWAAETFIPEITSKNKSLDAFLSAETLHLDMGIHEDAVTLSNGTHSLVDQYEQAPREDVYANLVNNRDMTDEVVDTMFKAYDKNIMEKVEATKKNLENPTLLGKLEDLTAKYIAVKGEIEADKSPGKYTHYIAVGAEVLDLADAMTREHPSVRRKAAKVAPTETTEEEKTEETKVEKTTEEAPATTTTKGTEKATKEKEKAKDVVNLGEGVNAKLRAFGLTREGSQFYVSPDPDNKISSFSLEDATKVDIKIRGKKLIMIVKGIGPRKIKLKGKTWPELEASIEDRLSIYARTNNNKDRIEYVKKAEATKEAPKKEEAEPERTEATAEKPKEESKRSIKRKKKEKEKKAKEEEEAETPKVEEEPKKEEAPKKDAEYSDKTMKAVGKQVDKSKEEQKRKEERANRKVEDEEGNVEITDEKKVKAEYIRLEEEVRKLAARNAHTGVDRTYKKIMELKGSGYSPVDKNVRWYVGEFEISAEVHANAAWAARDLGHTNDYIKRLKLAVSVDDDVNSEASKAIITFEANYSQVEFNGENLDRPTMPFEPDLRTAVEIAIEEVKSSKSYSGYLPNGTYSLNGEVRVVPEGAAPEEVKSEEPVATEEVKGTEATPEKSIFTDKWNLDSEKWDGNLKGPEYKTFIDAENHTRHLSAYKINYDNAEVWIAKDGNSAFIESVDDVAEKMYVRLNDKVTVDATLTRIRLKRTSSS